MNMELVFSNFLAYVLICLPTGETYIELSDLHMSILPGRRLTFEIFFPFSFAYTTSPAAVMKLVVFFRSSKPPYNFW